MAIFDLYSKRKKLAEGDMPDVFIYNDLNDALKAQIVFIMRDALGHAAYLRDDYGGQTPNPAYKAVHDTLAREYGVFSLVSNPAAYKSGNHFNIIVDYLRDAEIEKALDLIELAFVKVESFAKNQDFCRKFSVRIGAASAIDELNARFLEHGVGYSFTAGKIVQKNSEFAHQEIVRPALLVLNQQGLTGANEEFLNAHGHYRHGRYKECLADCLKAFESVMKTISKKRKWPYNETDTAKTLIDVCLKKGLVPTFLQSHCTGIRTSLESSVPTIRNRLGGHGQGPDPIEVPAYYAAFLLHQTAAIILFLIDADKKLKE